jgi:uncharacterized protein (DUF1684 family)
MRSQKICVLAIAGILLVSACSESRKPESAVPPSKDSISRERAEKDAFFMSANSPLLPKDRPAFHGLQYYPVDPALEFSVPLHRYPAPARVRLGTNTGEIRSSLRYGYFDFQVGGQDCRLQAYRLEDSPDSGGPQLFVPFRDATSGKETYAAGRYIDLKENTSGIYDLDFNRAYNPSCAYNAEFSCPVPPAENTLRVPIRAGEKKHH